ncbi:MAG: hypothetical protein GX221_11680 [Candidatus Riflebacteria bacterium]|nr:hypothetical protein [Candidatus Riflebacteria bacterium]
MAERILLTALGKNDLQETTYQLGNKDSKTKYACLAIAEIKQINKIIAFLTTEASEKHWNDLEKEAQEKDINVIKITIASGKDIQEVWSVFDEVTKVLQKYSAPEVTLDITNSLRHLPLLMFGALTYLESYKKVSLANIFYGAWEVKDKEKNITPVFDISPIISIIKGSYAVKEFEEFGQISGIKEFINKVISDNAINMEISEIIDNPSQGLRNSIKEGKTSLESLIKIKSADFERLEEAIIAGLPFESALKANRVLAELNDLPERLSEKYRLSAIKELLRQVQKRLETIALPKVASKANIELNEKEMDRQLEFIRWQIDINNTSTALLLLREWVVSRVFLAQHPTSPEASKWLKISEREKIEKELNSYRNTAFTSENNPSNKTTEKPYRFLNEWNSITSLRNKYAHGGFRIEEVKTEKDKEKVRKFYEFCLNNKDNDEFWILPSESAANISLNESSGGESSEESVQQSFTEE